VSVAVSASRRVRWRANEARWRAKNPEAAKASRERYYEGVKQDPERRQRQNENARIARRLRRERDGLPISERRRHEGERAQGKHLGSGRVHCKPVAAFMESLPGSLLEVCESIGIDDRIVRRWRTEEDGPYATVDSVQRVLDALDVQWWEVFDPSLFPGLYDVLRWLDVADAASRVFDGEALIG
jgi:hypothetical protein